MNIFLGIVWMCTLLVFLWKTRKYQRTFVENSPECKGIPQVAASAGVWIYDKMIRKKTTRELEKVRALVPGENPGKILRGQWSRTIGICICLFFVGGLLFLGMELTTEEKNTVTTITRPSFGTEKNLQLQVEGLEDGSQILVTIDGREPSEEELYAIFDQVYEEEKTVFLGENKGLDFVTGRLNFVEEAQYGIHLSYQSQSPEYLSNHGIILSEDIPREGKTVSIKVTLSYKEWAKEYELDVVLYPKIQVLSHEEELEQYIQLQNEDTVTAEQMELPAQFDGKPIAFHEEKKNNRLFILFLPVLATLILLLPKSKRKQDYMKRQEQLQLSYPGFLSKLEMLTNAGLSVRSVWQRLGNDYQKKKNQEINDLTKKKRKKKTNQEIIYVYEELQQSLLRLDNGYSEGECYLWFGQQCGLHSYMKLGSLLNQNIRQGISGLADSLEIEMTSALEERVNLAVRKGEQAATKLLFPMIMMLGVVIAVLLVPAFMSFNY